MKNFVKKYTKEEEIKVWNILNYIKADILLSQGKKIIQTIFKADDNEPVYKVYENRN